MQQCSLTEYHASALINRRDAVNTCTHIHRHVTTHTPCDVSTCLTPHPSYPSGAKRAVQGVLQEIRDQTGFTHSLSLAVKPRMLVGIPAFHSACIPPRPSPFLRSLCIEKATSHLHHNTNGSRGLYLAGVQDFIYRAAPRLRCTQRHTLSHTNTLREKETELNLKVAHTKTM